MDTVGDGLPLLILGFLIILAFLLIVLCLFYLSTFGFFLLGLWQLLFGRFLNLIVVVVLIRIQIFILPFEYDCLLLTDAAHGLFKGLSLLTPRCLLRLFPLSPLCV